MAKGLGRLRALCRNKTAIRFCLAVAATVFLYVFYCAATLPDLDKAVKNMLDNLKVGDRIWTIGGFYGTVAALKDDTVTLTMGSLQNTVVIKRSAVGGVENVAVENEAAPEI